jgi:hypothetical protein
LRWGDGNEVTKAKIEANNVTVSAKRRIVATTSETPRRERCRWIDGLPRAL